MKAVIGLFERAKDAEGAIDELRSRNFSPSAISVITEDEVVKRHLEGRVGSEVSPVARCARFGAIVGAIIGAIVAVASALGWYIVPPFEPIFITGSVADIFGLLAGIIGVVVVLGFILGILIGARIPEKDAKYYVEGLKEHSALVVVETPDSRAVEALSVLRQASFIEFDLRLNEWRDYWMRVEEAREGGNYPRLADKSQSQAS